MKKQLPSGAPGSISQIDFVESRLPHRCTDPIKRSRYLGCLLGGAVGDALGAVVEFMSLQEIVDRFGPRGIENYAQAYGRLGAITDDTQMTLFTAEGMLGFPR